MPRSRNCWSKSASPGLQPVMCLSSRAVSSNEFLWPAAWRMAPKSSYLTSPRPALDEQSKSEIEHLVAAVVRDRGLACVLVTHDRDQARRLCHRVVLLDAGEQ